MSEALSAPRHPTAARTRHGQPQQRRAAARTPQPARRSAAETWRRRWTLDDIPWRRTRPELAAGNEELFYMVTTASFIESTTHVYSHNLAQHFAAYPQIADWLRHGWEPEELQHGRALREYVRRAWPQFDWETIYARYYAEYSAVAKPENLLPLRSLELVSRCVVEMGTASYYTALAGAATDPALAAVAQHIYSDEVGHFKHFYKYFQQLREADGVNRWQIGGALWHRLKMIEDEDTYIALKHVYAVRHPGARFNAAVYKREVRRVRALAARHFPHALAVKMLLKPLELPPLAQRPLQHAVEAIARRVLV